MAGGDADEGEKEFEPSQRRLDQARADGDVLRSEDMQAAAGQAGLLLAGAALGAWVVGRAGTAGMLFLSGAAWPAAGQAGRGGATAFPLALAMAGPALLLLAGPAVAVTGWLILSRGLVLAPKKLGFRASRVSILANARQKFGRAGLVDFLRRTLKMLAVGAVLALYLRATAEDIFLAAALEGGQVARLMIARGFGLLLLFLALSLAFGLADLLWQRVEYRRRHRMTRKEMTDEMKESEGDPHLKADRRRRAQEIAMRKMLVEVPRADVVIVNPTHFAVALKWDRRRGRAPVCVAKGVDEVALRIRSLAQEHGVPLRRDPPVARMLHAALEIGDEIRPEHYAAVAAAIRFADAMRRRAGRSVLK